MFFRITNNIFALILLLNTCHTIFVILNVGHSCLTRSDVTLFRNNDRANFTNKRINDQFSNFFLKDKISYNSLMHFLIYVKSASTVEHSTLQQQNTLHFNSRTLYTSHIQFTCRFWKIYRNKNFVLHLHSDKKVVEVAKVQRFSCVLERLFKYNYNQIHRFDFKQEFKKVYMCSIYAQVR